MPNWCSNDLVIKGEGVEAILAKIKLSNDGIFEALIGTDPAVSNPVQDWYNHNVNWFGTKWDVPQSDISIYDESHDRLCISFDTAWSPPIAFFEKLCSKYDIESASLYYEEGGMDYSGIAEYDKENGVSNTEYGSYLEGKYNNNTELFWEELENYIIFCYYIENDRDVDDALNDLSFMSSEDVEDFKELFNRIKLESK